MTLADLIGRIAEEANYVHEGACTCRGYEVNHNCAALRARLREALRALVEAWQFGCGSLHDTGRDCPAHAGERAAALKKLEEAQ